MSVRRNSFGHRSNSVGRQLPPRPYATDSHLDSATKNDVLPNILPEVRPGQFDFHCHLFLFSANENHSKTLATSVFELFSISKLNAPSTILEELPLNVHVRHVEYVENGSERLTGTLYMTTFRLVFAPDTETEDRRSVRKNPSHKKYTDDSFLDLDRQ